LWKTFRIGRGVKKTNATVAEKMNYEANGIWLFAGEGAFCKRKPLPLYKMDGYCFSGIFSFTQKGDKK
jgi:hypothetical protein